MQIADEYVRVYGQDGRMLAVLDNAFDVSCTMTHNDLWTGSFSLPAEDPQNAVCLPFCRVRLPSGHRDVGLYRIIAEPQQDVAAAGGVCTYTIEHVMATLLDDVMFGYHEIGGSGMQTRQVMEYILSRQSEALWVLGDCDFNDEFAYKFENERLLPALMSLGNVLSEPYTWEFDTSVTPWRVSLRRADMSPACGIHAGRNMREIQTEWDASELVTRLYLLGYGEGVNQLTVRGVNGGLPYIDADTIGAYWPPKCGVFSDTRIEDEATLLARGRAVLDAYKSPYASYTASAADLQRLTGHDWDTYMPGKIVRVTDIDHGVDLCARIECVTISDMTGAPDEVQITIANKPRDAASAMGALADRVGIGELYSQGATNLYSQQYADNADASHPAVMRVYVPAGCVRINQVLISWTLSAFRAYETGAAAGGGASVTSTDGGASTVTSVAGGGGDRTSESGGAYTATSGEILWSSSGTTDSMVSDEGAEMYNSYSAGKHKHTVSGTSTNEVDAHTHYIRHQHHVTISADIPELQITVPAHSHVVSLGTHTHDVNVPAHSHTVNIDAHSHDIQYGIYEGGTAGRVTLRVDGTEVPNATGEMDVAGYFAKDADGKITRGAWHEIELIPDNLTRIEANLFVQAFVQSVGGGDY